MLSAPDLRCANSTLTTLIRSNLLLNISFRTVLTAAKIEKFFRKERIIAYLCGRMEQLEEKEIIPYDVIVVGAGAAGMMAAGTAARNGKRVLLIEKMEKSGRKVRITGKGRCNVTNARPAFYDFSWDSSCIPGITTDAVVPFPFSL